MNEDDEDRPMLISASEAEEQLRISSATVTQWAKDKMISSVGYYTPPGRAAQHLYLTSKLIMLRDKQS